MLICLFPKQTSTHQLRAPYRHSYFFSWVIKSRDYQREQNILSLHANTRWKIEWNDENRPAAIRCSPHTKWVEPVHCYGYSNIPSLSRKIFILHIKDLPCFTIRRVYHLSGWYRCPCLCHVICLTELSNMYNR
jgi:hypothetical protein